MAIYKTVTDILLRMVASGELTKKQTLDIRDAHENERAEWRSKMLKVREERGLKNRAEWKSGEDVYNWWIEEYKHNVKGQISIEEWLRSKNG